VTPRLLMRQKVSWGRDIPNGDGTYFRVWDVRAFIGPPPICLGVSHSIPMQGFPIGSSWGGVMPGARPLTGAADYAAPMGGYGIDKCRAARRGCPLNCDVLTHQFERAMFMKCLIWNGAGLPTLLGFFEPPKSKRSAP
jgi:hypothetical protein